MAGKHCQVSRERAGYLILCHFRQESNKITMTDNLALLRKRNDCGHRDRPNCLCSMLRMETGHKSTTGPFSVVFNFYI